MTRGARSSAVFPSRREGAAMIDRSRWLSGPWDDEPDRLWWVSRDGQRLCRLQRSDITGTWAGYVEVTINPRPTDPIPIDIDTLRVHGGITYCELIGGPIRAWWIGFDCGHATDIQPAMMADWPQHLLDSMVYWTVGMAIAETERLARQVAALLMKARES